MKKSLFFSSAAVMCMACPVFADPSHTSATFPENEYMQEDYTYQNQAVYDNTGVYEGTVTATAEYENIDYNLTAGKYLPQSSTTITDCPSGSFCTGIGNVNYSTESAQGATACSTVGNGSYTSSATGASASTDCYKACTTANVEHSATVTGNDYYGNGTDTCEPLTCVNGWHKKDAVPDLNAAIGQGAGDNSAYVNASGSFGEYNFDGEGVKGAAYYGLSTSNPNTWAVDYGSNGMLVGQGRCSTQPGVFDFDWNTYELNQPITTHTTAELGEVGGGYCYCNITGYTPANGTLQSLSSPWVYYYDLGGASNCASNCANDCAGNMRSDDAVTLLFRAALLGSVGASPASCEANTINITWNDASAEDIAATGAATTVYEGDIKTPLKAVTKPGKTFVGWKFQKPQQQSGG